MKYHIDRKHPEHDKKQHFCKFCEKSFIFAESLQLHNLTYHEKTNLSFNGKGYSCDICLLEFETSEILKDHKWAHLDGKLKCCPYCDLKTEHLYTLKFHIDRKHSDKLEAKFSCEICKKTFIFEASCRKHTKRIHLDNLQENVCHVCGFSTKSKNNINRHINEKHEVQKHKKCPHCDYHTLKLSGIQIHIDGHHLML